MWWPVNVAEIAKLQNEVVEKLRPAFDGVEAGSITTFAAVAVLGTERPRVVVPRVDRLAQNNPAALWRIAFDLFYGRVETASQEVLSLFEDWRPSGHLEKDGSAVSLRGMQTLQVAIDLFAERTHSEPGRRLAGVLRTLHRTNVGYAGSEEATQEASSRRLQYDNWADQIGQLVGSVQDALDELRREEAQR
jgi:hypothetical protein